MLMALMPRESWEGGRERKFRVRRVYMHARDDTTTNEITRGERRSEGDSARRLLFRPLCTRRLLVGVSYGNEGLI